MTLVSEIIQRSYREANLIPLGASPSTLQTAEALPFYNTLLLSTVGNEVSDGLIDSENTSSEVGDNTRLLLNLTAATTLYLDPTPQDGQRVAIVDVAGNLSTYNLTIDGNGRNIEGTATLVLSTDNVSAQWMYRADTANWTPIESLIAADTHPFPIEFDNYFITMLAMRINPRYGQALGQESLAELRRQTRQIRSRYTLKRTVAPEYPYLETDYKYSGTLASDFNSGD